MLLNLRYEWLLKSIEMYSLDSPMGAGWERISTVGFARKTVVGFAIRTGILTAHRTRTFNSAPRY